MFYHLVMDTQMYDRIYSLINRLYMISYVLRLVNINYMIIIDKCNYPISISY